MKDIPKLFLETNLSSGKYMKIIAVYLWSTEVIQMYLPKLSTNNKIECIKKINKNGFTQTADNKIICEIVDSIDWVEIPLAKRMQAIPQTNHQKYLTEKIIAITEWSRISDKNLEKLIEASDYNISVVLKVFKTGRLSPSKRIDVLRILTERTKNIPKGKIPWHDIHKEEIRKILIATNNWKKMTLEERCLFIPLSKNDPIIAEAVDNHTNWEGCTPSDLVTALEASDGNDLIKKSIKRELQRRFE